MATQLIPIKYLAKINPPVSLPESGEIEYLPMEMVKNGTFIHHTGSIETLASSLTSFQNGDIVIAKVTPCFENGNIALLSNLQNGVGLGSSELITLRPNPNVIPKFLLYALQNKNFVNDCANMMRGTGGMKRIPPDFFASYRLPLPPKARQNIVVQWLDKKISQIEKIINTKQQTLAKLSEYRQSLITKAVTKGLNPNVEMKNSGVEWIREIPHSWMVSNANNFFNYGKGLPITKADLTDNGIAVISYGQIHSKENTGTDLSNKLLRYAPENLAKEGCKCSFGDIVFADTSEDLTGLGNAVINNRTDIVYAGYHTIVAKPKNIKYSRYLSYLFQTDMWRFQLRKNAMGVKVFSLTKRLLSHVSLILPPETEINAIVEYLDLRVSYIRQIEQTLNDSILKLYEYRSSLITAVVTGQIQI